MTKCKYCYTVSEEPKGFIRLFCDLCVSDKPIGVHCVKDLVYLKGYGYESLKRINELERRYILPYEKPGGGYYLGRKSENGKIQEKHPNY